MRIGALVMPTDDWPRTVDRVQRLDELGFAHMWIYDHYAWQRYHERPWHGTYTWLAGAAAVSNRIRLGTMVTNPNIRHPLAVAKDAMTIDHISDGRFTLGLGAGGRGFDAEVLGDRPLTAGRRVERMDEFADVLDGLLTGRITDHDGRWYTINDARVLPGCIQRPRVPLAIAGGGRQALRIVAARADQWITHGVSVPNQTAAETRAQLLAQVNLLERACTELDRDPAELDRILLVGLDSVRHLDSIDSFETTVSWASSAGFTDLVFHHPRADDPEWAGSDDVVEQIAARWCRID